VIFFVKGRFIVIVWEWKWLNWKIYKNVVD
jgi:hypothetical protein